MVKIIILVKQLLPSFIELKRFMGRNNRKQWHSIETLIILTWNRCVKAVWGDEVGEDHCYGRACHQKASGLTRHWHHSRPKHVTHPDCHVCVGLSAPPASFLHWRNEYPD
jgi:hypothetical protein